MTIAMQEFSRFMQVLSEKSGDLIRPYFGVRNLNVERKDDASPVTRADKEAELLLRDLIRKDYPAHGIIGEEYGSENADAEFVWVLDPIDGTISFVHGCPLFGTLIALMHQGQPILGAIHQPILRQLCMGDGTNTWLNGERVRMRDVSDLSQATLLATDIAGIAKYQNLDGFERLRKQTQLFRTWGDCYGYLMLAAGSADIMIDAIMNPWDILPLVPIIRGAGGVITTWSGGDPVSGTSCVAASERLHPQVMRLLRG